MLLKLHEKIIFKREQLSKLFTSPVLSKETCDVIGADFCGELMFSSASPRRIFEEQI